MALPGLPAGMLGGGGAAGAAGLTGTGLTPGTTGETMRLPLPLPEWLSGNPLFTAGFGLATMGAAAGLVSRSANVLQVVLRRQLLMTLEIPSKDYSYQWVMQWLVAKGVHNAKHLGVETTYTKDAAGHQNVAFDFVPSPGRHWVWHRGSPILMERKRETVTVDAKMGMPWETLTLTAPAWRPTLFLELLSEAKKEALNREEGMTVIYQCYGHEWRPFGTPKRIRPFDSVVLDGEVSQQILGDVQEFLSSHQWYLDRGIPYRRGYLLHGPPGCGKSSFVAALAGRLSYSICVLNLGDPGMTDDRLQHLLAIVPPRCLVLLEDVDFAVGQHAAPDPSGPYAGVMRVTFSGLLNALDGVVATEERIVFMTTNHFRSLPRALVRPGRVDLSIYVGVASRSQLQRMYLRFFPGQEALAEQFASLCEDQGLTMAELQGFFLFFKNQPEAAVANVGPWLQGRQEAQEQLEREQLQQLQSRQSPQGSLQQQQQQQPQEQQPAKQVLEDLPEQSQQPVKPG